MRIQVQLFSHLRLAIGKRALALDLADGATVSTVMDHFLQIVGPDLESVIVDKGRGGYHLVTFVNGRRSSHGAALREGDTVSLLPPLGGG